MRQWLVLLQKEVLEMWRNFKWIWVPITFILLGVTEPLTSYYMQPILNALGGLPDGAVIEIPLPSAEEVLAAGLSQYGTLGVLIIVLGTMGIIANERKSGVAAQILVKPVSYFSYITSKWVGGLLLVWSSLLIGYLATWYYTGQLFEWVPIGQFFQSYLLFALWLSVVLTVTVFFSATLLAPGMAGFISIGIILVLSIVSGTLSHLLEWSPSQLSGYSTSLLLTGELPEHALAASMVALLIIIILLTFSTVIFKKKELAA